MFKFISVSLFCLGLCGGTFINVPSNVEPFDFDTTALDRTDFWAKWGQDLIEFLELIDIEQVMGVFLKHLNDPEVLNFITFVISPEFKEVVWEFETMPEFKEAFAFLQSKGYDVDIVMDFINSGLELPPFEKPILRNKREVRGLSGLIEDILEILPMEELKALFENKLENNQDLAELFKVINSEEFMEIMRRISQSQKFAEIKEVFKTYGFDFKYLCVLAQEIFGDYYQGIFCDH